MRIKIRTELSEYEALWEAAHRRGKLTKVERRSLLHLLMDHQTMSTRLEGIDDTLVEVTEED